MRAALVHQCILRRPLHAAQHGETGAQHQRGRSQAAEGQDAGSANYSQHGVSTAAHHSGDRSFMT